ncbi:MAG: helix-turn-helix transcriptional regulator [Candidatus Gastranaerophilales bacterium]|nr:helix-turn-helix transcriptional regulator [Candidatus Gastranaerophilales bacterium]
MKKLFGKRIKELRLRKNYTQEMLAELLGIGERNLSKIECGVNFVSAETLENLSKALNVSYKDLFDFEHLETVAVKKEELLLSIQEEKVDVELLYRIYSSLKK